MTARRGASGCSPRCVARAARFGYAPCPSLRTSRSWPPHRRPTRAAAADGWLWRELGATLALGWPIILANIAINVMTTTDFMMLGRLSPHALAAGLGRLLSLSAAVPARHRRRRRLVSDRRGKDRRRPGPGRAAARDPPGAPFRCLRRRRRVDRADLGDAVPPRHRRAARTSPGTPAFTSGASSGASRRACCSLPRARRSRRSSGPVRRWSPALWRSRSTRSPTTR